MKETQTQGVTAHLPSATPIIKRPFYYIKWQKVEFFCKGLYQINLSHRMQATVSQNECYTFGCLWIKMAFFKRAWRRAKVLSRPWVLGFKSALIRPLKWSTLYSQTPSDSKNTSRHIWKNKKWILRRIT